MLVHAEMHAAIVCYRTLELWVIGWFGLVVPAIISPVKLSTHKLVHVNEVEDITVQKIITLYW